MTLDWFTPGNRSKAVGKALKKAIEERPGTFVRLVSLKTRGAAAKVSDRQVVVDFLKLACLEEADDPDNYWFDCFKNRLSARFYHCCTDIEYETAEALLKAVNGFAGHMTGDHALCDDRLCLDERKEEIQRALARSAELNAQTDTTQLLQSFKCLIDEVMEKSGLMKKVPKKERLSPGYGPHNRTREPAKKLRYLLNAGMSSNFDE